jgi:hypothetical protein
MALSCSLALILLLSSTSDHVPLLLASSVVTLTLDNLAILYAPLFH